MLDTNEFKLSRAGIEHAQESNSFEESMESAATCTAVGIDFGSIDAGLAAVIDAWPTLPEAVRTSILAMMRQVRANAPAR